MVIYIIKAVKYDEIDAPVAVIWQHADAARLLGELPYFD